MCATNNIPFEGLLWHISNLLDKSSEMHISAQCVSESVPHPIISSSVVMEKGRKESLVLDLVDGGTGGPSSAKSSDESRGDGDSCGEDDERGVDRSLGSSTRKRGRSLS